MKATTLSVDEKTKTAVRLAIKSKDPGQACDSAILHASLTPGFHFFFHVGMIRAATRFRLSI